jgi:hypothetical protein
LLRAHGLDYFFVFYSCIKYCIPCFDYALIIYPKTPLILWVWYKLDFFFLLPTPFAFSISFCVCDIITITITSISISLADDYFHIFLASVCKGKTVLTVSTVCIPQWLFLYSPEINNKIKNSPIRELVTNYLLPRKNKLSLHIFNYLVVIA